MWATVPDTSKLPAVWPQAGQVRVFMQGGWWGAIWAPPQGNNQTWVCGKLDRNQCIGLWVVPV